MMAGCAPGSAMKCAQQVPPNASFSGEENAMGSKNIVSTAAHAAPGAQAVWELYACLIARIGPIATVIEWDNDIPDWSMLRAEAAAAEGILAEASRASAA